ncbi:MAG TPA: ABC transporter permease [Caulobacteraceae bacterium]|nr:ABC transporter permease [Caulobacteraceae bacterium]
MSLALSTLVYEWRRYLAAIIALAFSGLLVLATVGMFTGIVHSVLATTERSRADLFIMPVNAPQMIDSNTSLPARVQPLIYLNPEVVDVESLNGDGTTWVNVPAPGQKQVRTFVQVWSIDTEPGALTLPVDYPDSVRLALSEPGAAVVDVSDLARLGVQVGDTASLNGHTVHIRAVLHNYQNVNQPTVVVSRQTMRMLKIETDDSRIGPLMVKIRDPSRAAQVTDALNAASHGAYLALTKAQLGANDEKALLSEQIIGVLLIFFVVLAVGIGIGITSQTLRGAILSNIREFASLRALGISMGSLRLVVMELSFWVGIAGLFATALLTWLVSFGTSAIGLPLVIRAQPAGLVCAMLMILAVVSGAMAMGILKKSQPADLLR